MGCQSDITLLEHLRVVGRGESVRDGVEDAGEVHRVDQLGLRERRARNDQTARAYGSAEIVHARRAAVAFRLRRLRRRFLRSISRSCTAHELRAPAGPACGGIGDIVALGLLSVDILANITGGTAGALRSDLVMRHMLVHAAVVWWTPNPVDGCPRRRRPCTVRLLYPVD